MSADRDLVDVLADAVSDALDFFAARDEMNAKVHLAVTRWSPITEQCRQALDAWRNFRYPPADPAEPSCDSVVDLMHALEESLDTANAGRVAPNDAPEASS